MPKVILFDIDGTLILTGGAGVRAMSRAFEDVFRVTNAFEGISMPGRTDSLILADAISKGGLGAGEGLAEQVQLFRERYCEHLAAAMREPGPSKGVMPGVRELLEALRARGDVFLALLTGNYADAARIKLEYFNLWRYFPCGAYGDDAPDRNHLVPLVLERARACGAPEVAPHDVLVVGDTPLDVACAAAAGARSIAVATGPADVATLAASGATVVFPDLSDTAAFLRIIDDG